jgi:Skp family chaperone for outer membrane proteins
MTHYSKAITTTFFVTMLFNGVLAYGQAGSPASASTTNAIPTPRATKIAVVDPQKIVAESEEYRDKISDMQLDFKKRATDLQKRDEELKKKLRSLSTAANGNGSVERETSVGLLKEQKDIEIEGRSLESEFQQRQQELQIGLAQKVDVAIEAIAKDKWDAVIPKFFYASKDIDLTAAVTEQLNKEYKKTKAASKFKKDATPAKPAT